jgi:hypothetical protein
MTIRELLQYELWSKRTTRKILVKTGIFLWVAIGFLTIWILIEKFMLTPGERRTGREALVQIDGLQDFNSMSVQDFNLKFHQAENVVNAARMSAWTWRDKGVSEALSLYLETTKTDREEKQIRERLEHDHPDLAPREVESALEMETTAKRVRLLFRTEIHALLD